MKSKCVSLNYEESRKMFLQSKQSIFKTKKSLTIKKNRLDPLSFRYPAVREELFLKLKERKASGDVTFSHSEVF